MPNNPGKGIQEIKSLLHETVRKKDGVFHAPRPLDAVKVMRNYRLSIEEVLNELNVEEIGLFLSGIESLRKRKMNLKPSEAVIEAFRKRYLRLAGKFLED